VTDDLLQVLRVVFWLVLDRRWLRPGSSNQDWSATDVAESAESKTGCKGRTLRFTEHPTNPTIDLEEVGVA
jgi:hypothetical protein